MEMLLPLFLAKWFPIKIKADGWNWAAGLLAAVGAGLTDTTANFQLALMDTPSGTFFLLWYPVIACLVFGLALARFAVNPDEKRTRRSILGEYVARAILFFTLAIGILSASGFITPILVKLVFYIQLWFTPLQG